LFSSRPFNDSLKTWNWVVIITANVALCVLVAGSPHHPVYDEQWFLDTLDLLNRQGLSLGFLREFPGAAGPTFTLLFAAIDRVLTLSFPWLRFANVALLAAAATLIWRILAASPERNKDAPSPALLAASLTTLPTVGVSAGMALTEMPALFFIVVSVFLLTLARAPNEKVPAWLTAIGCGATIAFAVLGRQNYLVMLPALTLAFGWPPACRRHDLTRIAVIGAVVVVIAGPVFIVWGGLIPPKSAWSGDGFSPANAIRSAGYAGIIVLLFAPEIFRVLWQRKHLLAAAALASIPLSLATDRARVPMASLVRPLVGEQAAAAIATGFSFLLSLSAVCFLCCFVFYLWQERTNWLTRFAGSTALLGILSNAKITHQFSSRYVLVFLPFIVLATAPAVRTNWHQPLRLALGACISLGALASYYFGQ
jgi:4-amino-4-deoxy-L-arabinose transferase-like glycosyltransferase